PVREGEMRLVQLIVDHVGQVAITPVNDRFNDAVTFEFGKDRKIGWIAFTEVSKDKSLVLDGRFVPDAHLRGEVPFPFGGLLHALPLAVIFPAVVTAPDMLTLDPTDGQLNAAVRTARGNDVAFAAGTAVERKIFAHDAKRLGLPGRDVLHPVHGMPELSQIS